MSLEVWIAFAVTSAVLLASPGPTIMIVVSYALGHGKSSAWATVPGVALGDLLAMSISLAGAGAILAASATMFTILKFAGAAYLIWLGIQLWRSDPQVAELQKVGKNTNTKRMFYNSFMVTALNPKSIVFFIAFVPQFVDPHSPIPVQFSLLVATFVILAAGNALIWALLAGVMRERFKKPSTLRLLNRAGGTFLIGAGLLTAFARRTA